MTTIALIGCDGSGKTTLAKEVVERYPQPVKYLYMGTNASSSNLALPTSRLAYAWKVRKERKRRRMRGEDPSGPISLHGIEHRGDRRGKFLAALRLINRLAEESVRQIASWVYQARGYLVVYDRYFLFDFSPGGSDRRRLSERIHLWLLERVYPKPHLSLFLDAPTDVLLSRKQEVPAEYLERRREVFLERGATMQHFAVLDAAQSVDALYEDAAAAISAFVEERRSGRGGPLTRRARAS